MIWSFVIVCSYQWSNKIMMHACKSRLFRHIKFATKVLLFFELCKFLGDFFTYFDVLGRNMRSTTGFEEENNIAAAEQETTQFFPLTNWDLKF